MDDRYLENMNDSVMVSICCLVYNHEPYLRECFDGFLMQKTTFPIEILVHDDASTDHSADIIREYTAKYPGIFKPIYQMENQYSKGVPISATYQFPRAKGKYIALCEGDDYWTDPFKLQKQVEFLEANSEFSLCFHNVKIWKQKEGMLVDDFITRDVPSETDIYELAKGNFIHTPSVVFRKNQEVLDIFKKMTNITVGDFPLWLLNAQYGKIYKYTDCMAVYRYGSGIWSSANNFFMKLTGLIMLSKLVAYIKDGKVREELENQITANRIFLIESYNSLNNSLGYRIEKKILNIKKNCKR